MAYQKHLLSTAAIRGALVLLVVSLLAPLAHASGIKTPVAKAVYTTTSGDSTLITISGTAPMSYGVRRHNGQTLMLELPGVDVSPLASSYPVDSRLVSGVTVERSARAGKEAVGRLWVGLRAPARERSYLADNNLVLELSPAAASSTAFQQRIEVSSIGPLASGTPVPAGVHEATENNGVTAQQTPTPAPTRTPATGQTPGMSRQTTQSATPPAQGQQYGQPGFVGEPINLNVVNADIRDILNYITEQYGVNFVIDKSVSAVPVTVNVTDVPWNIALDAILKANRLGIDVNGNILRVASLEVIAAENTVQQAIQEARLNNAPLVTEFIRLNYARAVGTLAGAAGSTGGFAGGSTNQSFSGGAGGDATGTSGDQGILPIVNRRLSKRGSVEVDGRSNTLIITDVKENIDAIRQLVTLLDQPEPQVEIETRIVIANRNFSRDLGVQLAAVAIDPLRGGLGSFKTLNATSDLRSGPNPFGIPGGLGGSTQPSPALGATAPNTVIGLTTGIIGTAQISALITAGEAKGQAKIVATPRVTALNNRPAQIESGSQIPVVTPQATAGGGGGTGNVFTTTFVSVPLRLSVTPQITDAGTVVLRLVTENNSVNLGLTNSFGTPGIDTQRMQTEVLVPDGGTTVVGGVLADNEGETQNRTPGLSGIPVLGNLFKRKATTRTTNEILFFITPRIYRPDYQGRPTRGAVETGTRSVVIPQPVPLGNPPTNTPVPNLQPQQQLTPQTVPQAVPQTPVQPTTQLPAARPDANVGARP